MKNAHKVKKKRRREGIYLKKNLEKFGPIKMVQNLEN